MKQKALSQQGGTNGNRGGTTTSGGTNGGGITTGGTSSGGTTTTSSSSNGSGNSSGVNPDTTSAAHYFPSNWFFNQSVHNAAIDSQSATIISNLASRGGWGNSNHFQIDFSIDVYYADHSAVDLPFQDLGVYQPDSDLPPTVPVAPNASAVGFESANGLNCDGGDCHYLVVDRRSDRLIESHEADVASGKFRSSSSVVIWDFLHTYGPELRGDVCTSADAGGFPIAPMLFTAEEVAAGEINHAIRLILPNNRIQCRQYVRPASHTTGPSNCSGWASTNGVPYGARFRLKASYDVASLPTEGARVVARALQEYGMILADGGQIALTAKSDKFSATKWTDLLGATDLHALQVTDFDMIDGGTRFHPSSLDCTRAQ